MPHPTQVFLHNRHSLRVEFRLDDSRLELWWSPRAGRSFAADDRWFSHRDDHLAVFTAVTLPDCDLRRFRSCRYDPYRLELTFAHRVLHLAISDALPALHLWSDTTLSVDLKAARTDTFLATSPDLLHVRHLADALPFDFVAALAPGAGRLRHTPATHATHGRYARAELAAGQALALGVGLAGEDDIVPALRAETAAGPAALLAATDAALAPHEAAGRIVAPSQPQMEAFRGTAIRTLHSMIDDSAAVRASIKAIYYLIWVRDSGFMFHYQAAAGWTHRLPELCRLLLANPTTAHGPGVPSGRCFAQLIHPVHGKLEEDGFYYVVWTLFNHWTQTGDARHFTGADLELLDEALAWLENRAFDPARGLFGGYFADETPAPGSRDHGWDFATGQPTGDSDGIRHDGHPVARSYDLYLNTLAHSAYTMLAHAATDEARAATHTAKAAALWSHLAPLYADRPDGLPPYGDLQLADGSVTRARHWGPAGSTYVWGLALPNFLPLDDRDGMLAALLRAILARPAMHFMNGIASAVAACDPWFHDEAALLDVLVRMKEEALSPGPFLPMGGAMPEKFDAPQGNLYHDIRPQAFALSAWLGAWASLGVRRLAHGLAVRPCTVFAELCDFAWCGRALHFFFGPTGRALALEIDGARAPHTLQVPEKLLAAAGPRPAIRLVTATPEEATAPLLLRSTVRLDATAGAGPRAARYELQAFGLSELTFAAPLTHADLRDTAGRTVELSITNEAGAPHLRFTARGPLVLEVAS